MDKNKLKSLQKTLGYKFKDRDLLLQALTHPSFLQGLENSQFHNQRLEFLGDAVLGMIVADEIFNAYPEEREGFLTKGRSTICHGKGLTKLAKNLKLDDYLRLGRGEKKAKTKERSQILGDCLEAIIGAVYLDGGYKPARKLVLQWVGPLFKELKADMVTINYKGALQEWSQSHLGDNRFVYDLIDTSGPDHAKEFSISVLINDRTIASAHGYSKKEAESLAAKKVLELIKEKGDQLFKTVDNPDTPPTKNTAE
jgi:ribonuclease III